jgi:hypothetical protein
MPTLEILFELSFSRNGKLSSGGWGRHRTPDECSVPSKRWVFRSIHKVRKPAAGVAAGATARAAFRTGNHRLGSFRSRRAAAASQKANFRGTMALGSRIYVSSHFDGGGMGFFLVHRPIQPIHQPAAGAFAGATGLEPASAADPPFAATARPIRLTKGLVLG